MCKILITGAKGMLGQDLCPSLMDEGFETIETDIDNLDICDIKAIEEIFSKESPEYVIHCAAYTNVDKAEEEKEKAQQINLVGVENLAKICSKSDIPMIFISTDYVFDGEKSSPYTPNDKPNPINFYGLTKYQGEEIIKKYCSKYYIVRTSWLYGHHGKNFVETMLSLKDNPEIKVVDDQIGCPTWTMELSNGIIDLINARKEYGIYHICGSGTTSWYGFAREIFNLAGISVNLIPCATKDFPRPAKRPKYSVMDNNKACRNWKLALKDYINLRPEA